MQYHQNPMAVLNLKMIDSLIRALILQQIKSNLPQSAYCDTKLFVTISLNYYREGKNFFIITKNDLICVTKRQLECLQCLVDGLTIKETARLLFLAERTVETYLEIVRQKFKCSNKVQLIKLLLD